MGIYLPNSPTSHFPVVKIYPMSVNHPYFYIAGATWIARPMPWSETFHLTLVGRGRSSGNVDGECQRYSDAVPTTCPIQSITSFSFSRRGDKLWWSKILPTVIGYWVEWSRFEPGLALETGEDQDKELWFHVGGKREELKGFKLENEIT